MHTAGSAFRKPLIVVYGRGELPELAESIINAVLPDAFVVRPKLIPPQDLPAFCEENGGPSLVLFTNETLSGARASDIMVKLRELRINSLLMTDEYTDPRARQLGLSTMPKLCHLGEFQVHVQLALRS